MSTTKKIKLHSETAYLLANILISFAVGMVTAADFGVSMIVAPAYIVHLKFPFLTFGQSEYILQGIVIIVFFILMRKVKLIYFSSFITCLIYGAFLDLWRAIIPCFRDGAVLSFPVRVVFFIVGVLITTFAISLYFTTYFYPQVYEFFVKGVSIKYNISLTKFKIGYDFFSLTVAFILTLVFFGDIRGIGIGTIIMTCFNGILIGGFNKLIEKYFDIKPFFPNFAKKFDIV